MPSKKVYFTPSYVTRGRPDLPALTAQLPDSLYCARHCYKLQWELKPTKLRRCAGCDVANYCSRECQKSAWQTHRPACRSGGQSWQPGDDIGPVFPFGAVTEWVDNIHNYAITTSACGLVRLNGGAASVLASRQVVIFHLQATKEPNPAMMFQPISMSVVDKDGLSTLARKWDKWMVQCRKASEVVRRSISDPDRSFAGMLPALFIVVTTGLVVYHHVPLCVQQRHGTAARPELSSEARLAFRDVIIMCREAMKRGLVLRVTEDSDLDKATPDVGTYVDHDPSRVSPSYVLAREHKGWEWERSPTWNWDDFAASICSDDSAALCHSPSASWAQFHAELA
ncbi:hypothetical protein OH77DRAFT_1489445 [Trametes cingulata]|nr:hypothetical protein OH77DRAFT_1489445 [Trametes cingulata]